MSSPVSPPLAPLHPSQSIDVGTMLRGGWELLKSRAFLYVGTVLLLALPGYVVTLGAQIPQWATLAERMDNLMRGRPDLMPMQSLGLTLLTWLGYGLMMVGLSA